MLTAGVVSKDTRSAAALQACLQQSGMVAGVTSWTPDAERHPATGEPVPDVILLDLSEDPEVFFDFAAHLRRRRPTVHLIACSLQQYPEPELLLKAMRSGVQDFLSKPLVEATLHTTLGRCMKERSGDSEGFEKLIVVLGAKGGVGATTVAVNLGVQLAELTNKRVGLLDFGCPIGHVALMLDLQARFSVRDAIENLERLDTHFFSGLLTKHSSGLEVLPGTGYPDEWLRINVPALVRLIHVAQGAFDYVVVDYGSIYTSEMRPVLSLARAVLLVVQADVPSLWTLSRHLSALTDIGIDPERVHMVVNRWHKRDEEALSSVVKNLKRPIAARLPNDFKQVSEATNRGVPLGTNSSDPLATKFRSLARQVAGLTAEAGKEGGIIRLFSNVPGR